MNRNTNICHTLGGGKGERKGGSSINVDILLKVKVHAVQGDGGSHMKEPEGGHPYGCSDITMLARP